MTPLTAVPPSIADLTARFLYRTDDAATLTSAAAALGEVEPHEVSVGFRADPRLAWQESLEVLTAFGLASTPIPAPGEWGGLVVRQEAVAALPFALANYPQRVRELGKLVESTNLETLLPRDPVQTPISTPLLKWGTKHLQSGELPHSLIAAANYRAADDFDRADAALKSLAGKLSADWSAVAANEEAALLWQSGQYEAAFVRWQGLADSVPVLFNRGMAALFLGRIADARVALKDAVAGLADNSAWHHLASLYLALAETRGS